MQAASESEQNANFERTNSRTAPCGFKSKDSGDYPPPPRNELQSLKSDCAREALGLKPFPYLYWRMSDTAALTLVPSV